MFWEKVEVVVEQRRLDLSGRRSGLRGKSKSEAKRRGRRRRKEN